MTEETKVSDSELAEEGVPTPKFADESASPTSAVDPKELAKQVAEILSPTIESKVKSLQDKRFSSIEKRLGSLAELEELGVTIPENVKIEYRNRELDQRVRELEERNGSAPKQNSQGSGQVAAQEWSKIIADVGLDTKDAEVIALLRGEYRNLDHFESAAFRLKKKLDSKPNPSLETSPSLDGRKPVEKNNGDLIAELQQLQKTPAKNQKRMAEIEEKLGWK